MTREPVWITEEAAYAIHTRQLELHGGLEGVRDPSLLSSAMARPLHLFAYSEGNTNIATLAASYAYGIARNHPFLDGNKRTAAVVCETFIRLNRNKLTASDDSTFEIFRDLAAGSVTEEELAHWLSEHLKATS